MNLQQRSALAASDAVHGLGPSFGAAMLELFCIATRHLEDLCLFFLFSSGSVWFSKADEAFPYPSTALNPRPQTLNPKPFRKKNPRPQTLHTNLQLRTGMAPSTQKAALMLSTWSPRCDIYIYIYM